MKNRIKIEQQIALQNQKYEEFREKYEPMERVFEKWRNDNLLTRHTQIFNKILNQLTMTSNLKLYLICMNVVCYGEFAGCNTV